MTEILVDPDNRNQHK